VKKLGVYDKVDVIVEDTNKGGGFFTLSNDTRECRLYTRI
jgi:hypothetical protein